jgi:hypothetical protein
MKKLVVNKGTGELIAEIEQLKSRVHVNLGGTFNIGDYNSIKIDFGLSKDLQDDKDETIGQGFVEVFKIVQAQFNAFSQKIKQLRKTE